MKEPGKAIGKFIVKHQIKFNKNKMKVQEWNTTRENNKKFDNIIVDVRC